ncbi:MAG TPA: hypothetical protein PK530_12755 [Anaerolineales bacterium]|nr:hypothetical protein [Anaerolineales bacterium]
MKSNSAPINLPAQAIAQIAIAIAEAVVRGQDPKAAEQAVLARLTLNSR